jgi:hypothetical protein
MNRVQMETLRAEGERKTADELQEEADRKRHWNPFPRTLEAKVEAQLKREAWRQSEALVRGVRGREHGAAYEAASRLLAENRRLNRRTR